MPKEKKYLKLEAGERKAMRQSGAMKAARKGGIITKIYTGQRGGLWEPGLSSERRGPSPDATKRSSTTPQVETKRTTSMGGSTGQFQREAYRKQEDINQAEFEKTRLGARMVRKALKTSDKKIAKAEKRGEDTEMLRVKRGVRQDAALKPKVKLFKATEKPIGNKFAMRNYKKAEAEKDRLSTQAKSTSRYEKKRERMGRKGDASALSKAEAAGARKDARLAKRAAKRNS
jgi:hypothetical protein